MMMIADTIAAYDRYIPILDDVPLKDEMDAALIKIGKGVGLDGNPSSVICLMPNCFMDNILMLLKPVFVDDYPTS